MKNIIIAASFVLASSSYAGETHPNHTHTHGPSCGHTSINHEGHVDFLHDGHLHHVASNGVFEHKISVSEANPNQCAPTTDGHSANHKHGVGCGHEAIPHGDHVDYVVNGALHHPHGNHCDHHGNI